ncbi:thioredoxin [Mycoplasma sp. NEAQ87857]|uniref:thioredoxin family protein n=1 Tax=Mycoplasma sp. NEAQ87857 TaxID=2683967 RepID=UPI001316FF71|nr:thioredoxin family protein [Mycoplasma sp. NEAQ87857]QGZ97995.1 thioredoxin [Mycoplasma sp. NEAQ87857]
MLKESNKNEILENVKDGKGLQLVVFHATWCGPCRMYKSSLEELSEKDNVEIYRVDIDQNREYATEAGVASIPFTQVYVDGKLVESAAGYKPYTQLKEYIEKF